MTERNQRNQSETIKKFRPALPPKPRNLPPYRGGSRFRVLRRLRRWFKVNHPVKARELEIRADQREAQREQAQANDIELPF